MCTGVGSFPTRNLPESVLKICRYICDNLAEIFVPTRNMPVQASLLSPSMLLLPSEFTFPSGWLADQTSPTCAVFDTSPTPCPLSMPPTPEFTFPSSWLADQTLLYRAAQRGEQERSSQMRPIVVPSALSAQRAEERMQKRGVEPVAAFGPAGSR